MADAEGPKDRRVKVYELNPEGQWDDKGTGHVSLNPVPEEQSFEMVVQCEETRTQLLEHRVQREIDYARQGETIITWCQADSPDLALSFQEAGGCTDVWNRIVAIIGAREDNDTNGPLQGGQVEPMQLPEPSVENAEAILKAITDTPATHREHVASALLQEEYLKKLLEAFREVDKAGKRELAVTFFELFKHIVLLNEISIYEVLFSDEIFASMVAVFDYDPTVKDSKTQHREFLARAKFKQVMDIKDPLVVKKIHENYRMTYFKDVVLLRFLDDGALNTLGSLIYYNNATIISHITEYPQLVQNLFNKINTAVSSIRDHEEKKTSSSSGEPPKGSPDDCDTKDPFLFLQELCNIVKQMLVAQRDSFYKLIEPDVFNSIEDALWAASPQRYPWVWQASVDVLHNMLIHDSAMLRRFMVSRIPSKRNLLTRIVTMIVSEEVTPGLTHQLGEILRMVLDPEAMQTSDKDVFLDHFYKANAAHLDVALASKSTTMAARLTKYNALELFSMCAKQHGYRAKQYIIGHGILQKAVGILPHQDKQLSLSVIRFVRTCIGCKDPAYAKTIEKNRLLDPIIDLFVQNGARYNVLNSNVIELVDWIHRENIKNLNAYLMQDHGAKFEKVSYVDTFRMMAVQHENNLNSQEKDNKDEKMPSAAPDGVTDDSNCEYTYFESNDEGEENAPMLDLADENDGFVPMPRKTEDDDKEADLLATITKRQKTGKLRNKMKSLPKKIVVSRKNSLEDSTPNQAESPRKKRRT